MQFQLDNECRNVFFFFLKIILDANFLHVQYVLTTECLIILTKYHQYSVYENFVFVKKNKNLKLQLKWKQLSKFSKEETISKIGYLIEGKSVYPNYNDLF